MNRYMILSYIGVGKLKFGMRRADASKVLGLPQSSKKSKFFDELTEYRIENGLQLTFSILDDKLLEISLYPNLPAVEYCGIKIFEMPGGDAYKELHRLDPAPILRYGTTIFLELGLAVSGFLYRDENDKSVTVFTKGRWDELRESKDLDGYIR